MIFIRYVVVCVEAFAMIAISCVWRVVSFKHTHLVERIGLLTLIIMGEGIIGMARCNSPACMVSLSN
jgi:low temperature requirement protein LtrA